MKPRTSIFDSHSERQVFTAVSGSWEPRYRLFPHVPFASLIDLDPQALDAAQLGFLHKTSVDFVLAEPSGVPLFAIEFDGLGHGYSHGAEYRQLVSTKKDPSRGWKLDLKVRVADAARFPFAVISYDEKALVDEELNLIVLHGIVGNFLAIRHTPERIQQLLAEEADALASLPEDQRYERMQDLVSDAGFDLGLELNPIVRRAMELHGHLYTLRPSLRTSYTYSEDPDRPANCYPDADDFDQSLFEEWWHNVRRFGCTYTIDAEDLHIARTVWVRNIRGTGITPFGWLDELAELVAVTDALRHLKAP